MMKFIMLTVIFQKCLCARVFKEDICRKKEELFSVFTGDLFKHLEEWCQMQRQKTNTSTFCDQFLHVDFVSF